MLSLADVEIPIVSLIVVPDAGVRICRANAVAFRYPAYQKCQKLIKACPKGPAYFIDEVCAQTKLLTDGFAAQIGVFKVDKSAPGFYLVKVNYSADGGQDLYSLSPYRFYGFRGPSDTSIKQFKKAHQMNAQVLFATSHTELKVKVVAGVGTRFTGTRALASCKACKPKAYYTQVYIFDKQGYHKQATSYYTRY